MGKRSLYIDFPWNFHRMNRRLPTIALGGRINCTWTWTSPFILVLIHLSYCNQVFDQFSHQRCKERTCMQKIALLSLKDSLLSLHVQNYRLGRRECRLRCNKTPCEAFSGVPTVWWSVGRWDDSYFDWKVSGKDVNRQHLAFHPLVLFL